MLTFGIIGILGVILALTPLVDFDRRASRVARASVLRTLEMQMRLFEPSPPEKMEGARHEPARFAHDAAVVGAVAAKRRCVPERPRIAIWATVVAVVVGLTLPACADERPGDPFGNHTTEINGDAPFVGIWESLRHQMHFEKAYFDECVQSKDDPCPLIPSLIQKLEEICQYRGKALLGHLNISINLMIEAAPAGWVGPLEAITTRRGDCKSYSLAKYAAAQEVGISADLVRLVIVHHRARNENHMVVAVYQNGEWFILDNLTNVLSRDQEKTDYEPLVILDYKGARRYLSAFSMK